MHTAIVSVGVFCISLGVLLTLCDAGCRATNADA